MLILFWEGILWDSMGFGNSSFQLLLMDNVYFQREGTQKYLKKSKEEFVNSKHGGHLASATTEATKAELRNM